MLRLSRGGIRAIAITSATVLISILSVLVLPALEKSSDNLLKILAVLLQIAGLGAVIAMIEWVLLRLWIARFKGEWFYTSDSATIDPAGHVGVAKFFVRGGDIKYSVQLYTVPDATALANGDLKIGALAKGSADSKVVLFDGEDSVKILYDFKPVHGEGGLGVLDLTGVQNGRAMTGKWVMARREDKNPGEGTHKWFRREEFLNYGSGTKPKPSKTKK